MLMVSYFRTMEIVQAAAQQNGDHQSQHAMGSGASSVSGYEPQQPGRRETDIAQKQAESMFKVDFFEFYTLLERYITDCLAIFGVFVSTSDRKSVV